MIWQNNEDVEVTLSGTRLTQIRRKQPANKPSIRVVNSHRKSVDPTERSPPLFKLALQDASSLPLRSECRLWT